jgi:hypothetical protein
VQQAKLVLLDQQEQLDLKVHKDLLVQLVQQEWQAQQDQLVPVVKQD